MKALLLAAAAVFVAGGRDVERRRAQSPVTKYFHTPPGVMPTR